VRKIILILVILLLKISNASAQLTFTTTTKPSTCSSNGIITVNASGGSSPYVYQIISSTTGIVRPAQNVNVFNNLPSGSYTIRVSDFANITTTNTVIIAGNYIPLTFSHQQQQSTVTIIPVNGRSPYKFAYSTNSGASYTTPIDSGIFHCMSAGTYLFRVYDSCTNFYTETVVVNPATINATFNCINNNTGITLNTISGGNGGYNFHAIGSGYNQTNTTGTFSGITKCNKNIVIEVKDKCNVLAQFNGCVSPDYNFEISCINFKNKSITFTNVSGGNGTPYQYIANNLISNSTFIQNIPNATDSILAGIADSCGYRNIVKIEKFKTIQADSLLCESGRVVLNSWYRINDVNVSFPPTRYTSLSGPTSFNEVDTTSKDSSNVIISNLQTGNYTYKVTNACGDEVIGSFTYNKKCYNKITLIKSQTCSELRVNLMKDCTLDTNVIYKLYNLNNVLISQNTNGVFYGLNNDSCYKLEAKDIDCDTALIDNITPLKPKLRLYQNSCNELAIGSVATTKKYCGPSLGASFAGQLNIVLTDSLYNILLVTPSRTINPVPANTYWVYATSDGCNSDTLKYIKQSGFKDTIQFCITPTVRFVGNRCKPTWQVKMLNNSLNINYHLTLQNGIDLVSNSVFIGVDSGRYFLKDGCNEQELYLPNYFNFKSTINPGCPSNASITASNFIDTAYINGLGKRYFFNICSPTPTVDYNLKEVGTNNQLTYSVDGNFSNLKTGTFYAIFYKGNESCNFGSDTVFTPFYTRPALTATYGLICNGNNATVKASVVGGTPPYTYEVLNSSITDITTDSTFVLYNNLPLGVAEFRVSDVCGISTNFSTEVLSVNFQPTYKKKCDGTVQLIAPDIFNTEYVWTNKNNDTIGTTPTIYAIPNGDDTFNVTIKHLSCTLNKTLYVSSFSSSIATANAGPNLSVDTTFAILQANTTPTTAIGTWRQIDPSSGNTIFDDIHLPNTKSTVNIFPGQYTYVWTVQDTVIGCTTEDTVVVSYLRCPNILPVLFTKTVKNASCNGTAQIDITINQSSTPVHYLWNTGDTTASIKNLTDTMYTVIIKDETSCTPDIYDTTYLIRKINTFDTIKSSICNGDTIKIGLKKYFTAGNFKDTLINSVGCDSILSIEIILLNNSNAPDTLLQFCEGETYTAPNGQVFANSGSFILKQQNSIGCDSITKYNLLFHPSYNITIDTAICEGFSYILPHGNIVTQSGNFTDSFQTINGCDSIIKTTLLVKDSLLTVYIGNDTTICAGDAMIIELSYPNYVHYLWQDSSVLSKYTINKDGIYYVQVYDGCTSTTDTLQLKTKDCTCFFYVPTAFTPNNDGNNDVFKPFNKCTFYQNYSFSVFNRWSQLVFKTNDAAIGWNGFYKDEMQQVDSYVWYLDYFDVLKNEQVSLKGTVSLIK
jgi:gliding motility-associated-like protein